MWRNGLAPTISRPNDVNGGPFDAEEAAGLVASVFGEAEVEAEWWDLPAYHLPTRAAVVDDLVAFGVPEPEACADRLPVPLDITKEGVNVWARRGRG